MTSPTITFESYVLRGRNEREYDVTVTYRIIPGVPARLHGDYPHPEEPMTGEITSAAISDDTYPVTASEYDQFDDEIAKRIDDDYRDWCDDRASDEADYRREDRWAA